MKKLILLTVLLSLTRLGFAQFSFEGELKNASNKEGISSAFIRIHNDAFTYNAYSTPNGSFKIENVATGKYTLSIAHIGYEIFVREIEIIHNDVWIFQLNPNTAYIDAAIVSSVRAGSTSPTTFTDLQRKEIQQLDQSKDFPFILNLTPSTVISSDAGNGVGYTGIRIRGVDPTRVNVTINGIPLNDGESQGTYWVDLPDLASSTQSVQVQRGVGTSTNGAAAFGASVNVRTLDIPEKPVTLVQMGGGSYNTFRTSFTYGSGRLNDRWAWLVRTSLINSDGFIDRASSQLRSLNFVGSHHGKRSTLKTNMLLGHERTYQAWWGIPEPKLYHNTSELNRYTNQLWITGSAYDNLKNSNSRTYNYYTYENEVDNYNQNHYQLFYDYKVSPKLKLSTAAYATTGKGYFEQFRPGDELSSYGIGPEIVGGDTFYQADIVRRRWLDNTLVGGLASANYSSGPIDLTLGGGISQYTGRHFGEAIATEYTGYEDLNAVYYDNDATKQSANFFVKKSYNWNNVVPFIDLQYRWINYQFEGLGEVGAFEPQEVNFIFFNPKIGLTYLLNHHKFYTTWAQANREPVRDDFRNSPPSAWPKQEQLHNTELGYRYSNERKQWGVTLYNMSYSDQLVLTGAVNNVGEALRTNVAESYRRGVELEFQYPLTKKLQLGGNATFSVNKIANFTEVLYAWDRDSIGINAYENTDISFSPNRIISGIIGYRPNDNLSFNLIAKHVGSQYLDNTQSEDRMLKAFTVIDASMRYENTTTKGMKNWYASLFLNNVLDAVYAPNGYTFSGILNNQRADFNYLYPMAGFNWMIKLGITL